ncbi:MAG: PQQ-binding-like beta-propeller repeat protein [Acidobacteriota bacterium]|nr:PQQ-binding-like beta-propeller repeat protein [Acidobacteriota bacterium]
MRHLRFGFIPIAALLTSAVALAAPSPEVTFFHLSDIHYPHERAQSQETINALPCGKPIDLAPFGVTVAPASFAIATGDLNEFGGGDGGWEGYLNLWRDIPLPIYHQSGNHDGTWDCARPRIRRMHGGAQYAFESGGVKLIGFDTATPQDPRPSIGTEGILWLAQELRQTPPDQPVLFFCHHPLDGREFAGSYDRARLLELLQSRNVLAILVGHGHGVRAWKVAGMDMVMGGSTYGKTRGFGIVSISNGMLRICHQYVGEDKSMVPLLEKPIARTSPFIPIADVNPPDATIFATHEPLAWSVRTEPTDAASSAVFDIDGGPESPMRFENGHWSAEVAREGLEPGAHVVRFEFSGPGMSTTTRTHCFWIDGGAYHIAWKSTLSGSCQSTPTVHRGVVCVGCNDGTVYALDGETGEIRWRFITGGEVRSQPMVTSGGDAVVFGSADGNVYCVETDGALRWKRDVGGAVYATVLLVGDLAITGSNSGTVVALKQATGAVAWTSTAPEYAVESGACAGNGMAFAGAWDRFIYGLDLADGSLKWRTPSRGAANPSGAARYYSPADCAPVFAGGNVFAADRAYTLTVLDAATGEETGSQSKVGAVSTNPDGSAVYLRRSDGKVVRLNTDGTEVWTAEAPTGYAPSPVAPCGDEVRVASTLGTLTSLDAASGSVLRQYKAFPDTFVFASPAYDGGRTYLVDMTGTVLALDPR